VTLSCRTRDRIATGSEPTYKDAKTRRFTKKARPGARSLSGAGYQGKAMKFAFVSYQNFEDGFYTALRDDIEA